MKVLLVNHTSVKSGAEMSLLDLMGNLPVDISAALACPEGELADAARREGSTVLPIPSIDGSFRPHPFYTSRGAIQVARTALTLRRLAARTGADVVHANSARSGLAATLAFRLGGPPVLVHIRDCLPAGTLARLTRGLIERGADAVLANSRYTAARFIGNGDPGKIRVIYGPVDFARLRGVTGRSAARSRLGLQNGDPLLGVVGQITPWKGQDTAIRVLARLKSRHFEARLLIAGEAKFRSAATRYDNASYLRELHGMVAELGLQKAVIFLGERQNIGELLSALDLLLVPSWEEPLGRTVLEAMAVGTPVLATTVGGPAEIIEDGIDGRLIPPREPELWAAAAAGLLNNHELRERIADAGREKAQRFDVAHQVNGAVEAYREVLAQREVA